MRDVLVALELRRNRTLEARRLVELAPEEVSNVVALHVLAASHRPGQARIRLDRIRNAPGPADVIELAEEIARRHQLTAETPRHSKAWITGVERQILLAEAA